MSNTGPDELAAMGARPTSRAQIAVLFIILCISFFLRLAMVDMIEGTVPIRNDAKEYYYYAVNMKYAGVYSSMPPSEFADTERVVSPDATRPPGYAAFLYPFVTVPPTLEMVYSIRIAQVILSTLTVLLSFMVFRHFLSGTLAMVGTLLVGLSPHLVSMNIYLLTEAVFAFVLMLFVYLAIQGFRYQSYVITILAGIILGVAVLIKSSITYFLYLLIAVLVAKYRATFNYKLVILLGVGFLAAQSPWLIRNLDVGIESAGKSKALVSLQNGSYPGLMYNDDPRTAGIPHRADPAYNEIKDYGDFFLDLIAKVTQEPGKYMNWYALGKLQMMLSWNMVAGAGDIFIYPVEYSPYTDRQPFVLIHSTMKAMHPALMVLAMLGMLLAVCRIGGLGRRDGKSISLLLCGAIALYFVALHIVVTPLPRYMIPLRPLLYGLALYCVSELIGLIQRKYAR